MTQEVIDISPWTGTGMSTIYIRFQIVTDGSNNADGFHIDMVELSAVVAMPVIPGDVNGDGIVDVLDIVTMVSIILGEPPTPYQLQAGDLNGDGIIDVLDIVSIINEIL